MVAANALEEENAEENQYMRRLKAYQQRFHLCIALNSEVFEPR